MDAWHARKQRVRRVADGASSRSRSAPDLIYPCVRPDGEFTGSDRLAAEAGGVVEEVVYGSIYEGQADVYIGLSSEQPFRVFYLEDPTRVVIDVQHP